ncbi:hypothetical protein KL86DPRO_60058 [uncultured delta proteobacterium]|uniref:Uncharacterized protein n=1 Tax=uncultured delta proteobacterium TaxID=34034 RepID=A0A212KEL2_9DELT|nr:hypothetical protein KL86DPRO_60058 [uncultured delta proteobacterium]
MSDNWDELEKPLRQLLGQVKANLSASERREIEEYINGNEFDAAMEALVDFLAEKTEPISKPALASARKLATAMELDGELKRINTVLAKKTG